MEILRRFLHWPFSWEHGINKRYKSILECFTYLVCYTHVVCYMLHYMKHFKRFIKYKTKKNIHIKHNIKQNVQTDALKESSDCKYLEGKKSTP